MTVYVDDARIPFKRMLMCHMIADSVGELFEMAEAIGLNPKWFQSSSFPHFDVSISKRRLAIERGALLVDRRGLVAAMKAYRARTACDAQELAAVRAASASNPGSVR